MTALNEQQPLAMKCEDLLALLNDYVDGSIDPTLCAAFEAHMAGCNPCQVVIDNIRKTITLFKHGEPCELPLPFRQQLHDALRRRWKECHECAAGGSLPKPDRPQ